MDMHAAATATASGLGPARTTRSTKSRPLGSIHDDLAGVAGRIFDSTLEGPVLVWVDADAQIHVDAPDAAVSAYSIVGIYNMCVSLADMVEDLTELRRERVRCGMLD
jgi:hypothetical protein